MPWIQNADGRKEWVDSDWGEPGGGGGGGHYAGGDGADNQNTNTANTDASAGLAEDKK